MSRAELEAVVDGLAHARHNLGETHRLLKCGWTTCRSAIYMLDGRN
jgi:hypothetical protein